MPVLTSPYRHRSAWLAIALLLSPLASLAQGQGGFAPPPPEQLSPELLTPQQRAPAPPPAPEGEQPANPAAQPEVVIRNTRYGVAQEYRLNGRLYMVRIKPRFGPEYFLMDNDGDGYLESRYDRLGGSVNPPMWRLFSW